MNCVRFVFHRTAHHHDLHSFPTRRSSDLSTATHGGRRALRRAAGHDPPGLRDHPGVDVGARVEQQSHGDRKSTRLNSSHRTISYAVFCLKKKNVNLAMMACSIFTATKSSS